MNYQYYTEEYQEYAEELEDIDSLRSYKDNLSENVESVSQIAEQLQTDIEEMAGEAFTELNQTTIGTILNQVNETKDIISNSLEGVISSCDNLSNGLKNIKDNEDVLITSRKKRSNLRLNPVNKGDYDQESGKYTNQTEYNSYVIQLIDLNTTINKLIQLCEMLKTSNDADISLIKEFNTVITDFTAQLFSLSITLGDTDFSNFASLSTKEKEKLIQNFIDSLTNRYNELNSQREALEAYLFDKNTVYSFFPLMKMLGYSNHDLQMFRENDFSLEGFKAFRDFFYAEVIGPNGESLGTKLDIIDNYFNNNQSWDDSGMNVLFNQWDENSFLYSYAMDLEISSDNVLGSMPQKYLDLTTWLANEGMYATPEEIKAYLANNFVGDTVQYFKDFPEVYSEYQDVIYEMTTTNTTIYNLQQLKKQVVYFEYAAEEDYQNFEFNPDELNAEWLEAHNIHLDLGVTDGYQYDELFNNMSDEEKKMFAYCLTKGEGDGLEIARKFLRNNAAQINERIGYQRATDFLDWINGPEGKTKSQFADHLRKLGYDDEYIENATRDLPDTISDTAVLWDRVCDTANTFGKGVVCGGQEFAVNIQSLWEPTKVMTPGECETAAILSLLGSDGSPYKDDLLYGAFSVGKYIGKDAAVDVLKAIPATHWIGEGIDFIETLGEKRKGYFRMSGDDPGESYFGSAMHATFSTLTEKGIDYVMSTDAAKDFFGVGGETLLANPNIINSLDSEFARKTIYSATGNAAKTMAGLTVDAAFTGKPVQAGEFGKVAFNAVTDTGVNLLFDPIESTVKTAQSDFAADINAGLPTALKWAAKPLAGTGNTMLSNAVGTLKSGTKAAYQDLNSQIIDTRAGTKGRIDGGASLSKIPGKFDKRDPFGLISSGEKAATTFVGGQIDDRVVSPINEAISNQFAPLDFNNDDDEWSM